MKTVSDELYEAASCGSMEDIKTALSKGADINFSYRDGVNVVMSAAYHGNDEVVKYLVEHGADYKKKTKEGKDIFALIKEGKENERRYSGWPVSHLWRTGHARFDETAHYLQKVKQRDKFKFILRLFQKDGLVRS